jgi:OmpA-OmpF porin, OOP family
MLLATAASVMLVTPASATHFNGWYFGIEGGAVWVDDVDLVTNVFTSLGATVTTGLLAGATFDAGWAAMATVGYGFGGGFRAEFEAGFRKNDGDNFTTSGVLASASADLEEFTLMANALYDIRLTDNMSFSIGGGIGGDHAHYDLRTPTGDLGDSDWFFAWQGIAGFNVAIGETTALFVNYRYFNAMDPSFELISAPNLVSNVDTEDFVKHSATIGLRFDLVGEYVAPPPAPTPPPPPPAAPREFIVFFGFNKSNLTAEAVEVVKQAAAAFKETGSANVKLVGHTDRSGSDAYNNALSLRRGDSVKAALVAEGVPEGSISVEGRGEAEPTVPTDDGVREPQNRRVNITL